jgi:site-specific DNA-methyltransferase (adenine-specific)
MMDGIHAMDCLMGLAMMQPASVDLVFADLPYGRTQNVWDEIIPMDRLWPALQRVCRPTTPLVFTAMQPFAALLVCSNLTSFRYEVIWEKNKPRGFLNAKKQPLRVHENVLVFYDKQPKYTPQMSGGHKPVNSYTKRTSDGSNYGRTKTGVRGGGSTERYPTSILRIPVVNNDGPDRVHPTQKPEELAAWFIRTYTDPGDLVLDPTVGSGSTLRAARQLDRRIMGFEIDRVMAQKARQRVFEV